MSSMGCLDCCLPRGIFTARVLQGTWPIVQVLGALLVVSGCGDDGDGSSGGSDGGTGGAQTTDGTSDGGTGAGTSGVTDGGSAGTGVIEPGPNFGVLNFTYYPATAAGLPEELGLAGAWRTEALTTEDFYAVQAWSMHLPPPPADPDTVVNNEIPAPYAWGFPDTWVAAGNALKLRPATGDEALACLFQVEGSYPIYLADDADSFDDACAPDPARWQPAAAYDLIAFGGDQWDDVIVPDAITTPDALTLTAPDVSTSLFPLDRAADLALAWNADAPADRVVVRVIDTFGQVLTAHAADDGAFTIPAVELKKLADGPATLTIARERVRNVALPTGTLRVIARHELWADPDLL